MTAPAGDAWYYLTLTERGRTTVIAHTLHHARDVEAQIARAQAKARPGVRVYKRPRISLTGPAALAAAAQGVPLFVRGLDGLWLEALPGTAERAARANCGRRFAATPRDKLAICRRCR